MPRINMELIRRIFIGVAVALAVVFIGGFSWFLWVTRDLPSEEQLANYEIGRAHV